jgi:hypothetical protein
MFGSCLLSMCRSETEFSLHRDVNIHMEYRCFMVVIVLILHLNGSHPHVITQFLEEICVDILAYFRC